MQYRREIDGLRSIAVLPVILFHAGFSLFSGGYVGVDVFFVISGYLITSIILSDLKTDRFSIINFYERRARRILPALFLIMGLSVPAATLLMFPLDFKEYSRSLFAVSTFISNLHFWHENGYFNTLAELKPLLHTWSLAVEEQFYVIFPIFMIVAWRWGRRLIPWILIFAIAFSLYWAQHWVYRKPSFVFFWLPTRAWELLIGSTIAIYLGSNAKIKLSNLINEVGGFVGLFLIGIAVFKFTERTPFPGVYALAPVIGAAFIILFTSGETYVGKILGNKLCVGIGLISYSLYLWHQPIFAFARHWSAVELSLAFRLELIAASLVLAALSWYFVEQPFRNKNVIGRKAIFAFSGAGLCIFAGIGFAGNTGRLESKLKNLETKPSELTTAKKCPGFVANSFQKNCRVLGANVPPTILLVGDSHAEAIQHELEKNLLEKNLSAFAFTHGGCTPIKDVSLSSPYFFDECIAQNRYVYSTFLNDEHTKKIDTVILYSRWTAHWLSSPFDNGEGGAEIRLFAGSETVTLTADINGKKTTDKTLIEPLYFKLFHTLAKNKKLILVYPTPEAGWNVPRLIIRHPETAMGVNEELGSTSHALYISRHHPIFEMFDRIPDKIIRINPEPLFCNQGLPGRCITQKNGVPLYYDDNHLSDAGAKLLIDKITEAL